MGRTGAGVGGGEGWVRVWHLHAQERGGEPCFVHRAQQVQRQVDNGQVGQHYRPGYRRGARRVRAPVGRRRPTHEGEAQVLAQEEDDAPERPACGQRGWEELWPGRYESRGAYIRAGCSRLPPQPRSGAPHSGRSGA
eukprot:scaffold32664_cov84-Isochrysis_galbana.AAC.3